MAQAQLFEVTSTGDGALQELVLVAEGALTIGTLADATQIGTIPGLKYERSNIIDSQENDTKLKTVIT